MSQPEMIAAETETSAEFEARIVATIERQMARNRGETPAEPGPVVFALED